MADLASDPQLSDDDSEIQIPVQAVGRTPAGVLRARISDAREELANIILEDGPTDEVNRVANSIKSLENALGIFKDEEEVPGVVAHKEPPSPSTTTPTKDLPNWRGNAPLSLLRHLSEFRTAMEVHVVPLKDYPRYLLFTFPTTSHSWAREKLLNQKFSWPVIRSIVMAHFCGENFSHDLFGIFENISQRLGESVQSYYDRFTTLLDALDGEVIPDSFAQFRFIRGLRKEFRVLVSLKHSKEDASLLALLSTALSVEKADIGPYTPTLGKQPFKSREEVNRPDKQCAVHGVCKHSTEECKARLKGRSPKDKNKAQVRRCYTCGDPGHVSPQCPNKKGQPSSTLSKKEVKIINAMPPEENNFDFAHEVFSRVLVVSNESAWGSKIMVPAVVAGTQIMMMLDTGADVSCVDPSLLPKLRVTSVDSPQTLGLADESQSSVSPSYVPNVDVCIGSSRAQLEFRVLALGLDRIILGNPDFAKFGISVGGIPVSFPDGEASSSPPEAKKDAEEEERIAPDRLEQLESILQPCLQRNLALPEGSKCLHPAATFTIETGDTEPVYVRQYPIAHALKEKVQERVDEWAAKGYITPAPPGNLWNMPLNPQRKISGGRVVKGEIRLCMDPRELNKLAPFPAYVVPRIADHFEKVAGFAIASSLDGADAYHMFKLSVTSQHKSGFTDTRGWKWMWQVLFFGHKCATSHYQRVMEILLAECSDFVIVYVDDIFIFTKVDDLELHASQVAQVIDILTQNCFKLRIEKCKFGCTQVRSLGFLVQGSQRMVDPSKIQAVQEVPRPVSGKAVESWLGLVNYLRDFVPLYAHIAAPLERLRKFKVIRSELWGSEEEESFRLMKRALSSPPVLTSPEWTLEFFVAVDASQWGVGCVLYQLQGEETRYISFASKALSKSQVNYSATRRELLAIVFALKQFRHFLWGKMFTLFTDHKSLTYLFTAKSLNYALRDWMQFLLEYTFKIVHRPGVLNVLPHHLSHLFDGMSRPLDSQLPHVFESDPSVLEINIRNLPVDDSDPKGQFKELSTFIKERLGKTALPTEEDQLKYLEILHLKGHIGAECIFQVAWKDGQYWPKMRSQCSAVTESCELCLKHNVYRAGFHPLRPIGATLPMDHVVMDFAGPFPTSSAGYTIVLVIKCVATRFVILRPCRTKEMAEIAWILFCIFADFGIPKILQSDNDPSFVNQVIEALKEQCGFDHRLVHSYNPAANGAAEKAVDMFKTVLKKFLLGSVDCWELVLPAAQIAINERIMARHGSSPFAVMHGRSSNPFVNYSNVSSTPASIDDLLERNRLMIKVVFPALRERSEKYMAKYKSQADRRRKIVSETPPVGSFVMKQVDSKKSKLHQRWEGPFEVSAIAGDACILKDATGERSTPVPVQRLRPIKSSGAEERILAKFEVEKIYEVEAVLDHRGPPGKREYYVKWKGYEEKNWEPIVNFNSDVCIRDYWKNVRVRNK